MTVNSITFYLLLFSVIVSGFSAYGVEPRGECAANLSVLNLETLALTELRQVMQELSVKLDDPTSTSYFDSATSNPYQIDDLRLKDLGHFLREYSGMNLKTAFQLEMERFGRQLYVQQTFNEKELRSPSPEELSLSPLFNAIKSRLKKRMKP